VNIAKSSGHWGSKADELRKKVSLADANGFKMSEHARDLLGEGAAKSKVSRR